ncbi:MAG: NUDIX domain-containing protein [Acidiferrobacteraceae bacterium]|jgi:predicted NUDIX family NTP pyrophosphohydrolase
MSKHSAGILLFRHRGENLEVLLAHPGGPYWANKDLGSWSIPKGLIAAGEAPLAAARREFQEETGFDVNGRFIELGTEKQASGKIVHAWALEGDLDPDKIVSNTFSLEWPPRSGQMQEFPEVDRGEWFDPETARNKITTGQRPLLERLLAKLRSD